MELEISNKKGPAIPREFIGLFIEDINYAIDGGLYAEMLENRNFESMDVWGGKDRDYFIKQDGLYAWSILHKDPGLSLDIVQGSSVHENNPHYLRVTASAGGSGFYNKAYEGLHMKQKMTYHISFYARAAQYSGKVKVAVIKDERTVAERDVEIREADACGWHKWEKYKVDLTAEEVVCAARFAVVLENPGTIEFDCFSMMPEDAVYGIFRRDLADMLKGMNPGFLRFPGGCVVEGATLSNRYRFKDTLDANERRRYNWNRWALHGNHEENEYHSIYSHYGQTYGIGFYEYFLLCEYIGAVPLPILSVGLACQFQSHERVEPDSGAIREYIQDYLDLIEFANGGADTKWGALRIDMGHEEPFGLEMIGVGNEQWEDEESRFFERYMLFEKEIHKVYPQIKLIGTSGPELDSPRFEEAWKFYREHAGNKNFVYAVDEHYYKEPEWFGTHTDYFDKVPRDIKIFFGEYAAHPQGWLPMNHPEGNNLKAALAEAAFLTGAAKNSDVVAMTSYAPLFARIGYAQWNPDLIWFDGSAAYATPNYYVQQMFALNAGDYNIVYEMEDIPCQVSYEEKSSQLIVKLVNMDEEEKHIKWKLEENWELQGMIAEQIVLRGDRNEAVNSLEGENVRPVSSQVELNTGSYFLPPLSFVIVRIPAKKHAELMAISC